MRRIILEMANLLLRPFGAEIVKNISDAFHMTSAVQRIVKHNITIRSIIDIGASNGKWSIDTMKIFPRASFLAIEPLHEHEGSLDRLRLKHHKFDYVICVAGDKDDQSVTLNVSDDLDGSTIDGIGGEPREVPANTIDAIVSERKLEGPFLLKLDTHGYEIPILNGAKDTLGKTNVIIMEVYNFKVTDRVLRFHEMCIHMENMGFRCYDIAGPMPRLYDGAFWQMDIFFCKSNSNIFSYTQYK